MMALKMPYHSRQLFAAIRGSPQPWSQDRHRRPPKESLLAAPPLLFASQEAYCRGAAIRPYPVYSRTRCEGFVARSSRAKLQFFEIFCAIC